MKIRTDFVTNSSSSSFILARDGDLTKKQKEAIIKIVKDMFLGEPILKPGDSEERIKAVVENDYYLEKNEKDVREVLNEGKTIYEGNVDFEEAEWHLVNMYSSIWNILAENGPLDIIDGDLNY